MTLSGGSWKVVDRHATNLPCKLFPGETFCQDSDAYQALLYHEIIANETKDDSERFPKMSATIENDGDMLSFGDFLLHPLQLH